MSSELERPLGQDRGKRGAGGRLPRPGRGSVLGAICAVLLLAGSFYTALAPQNIGKGYVAPATAQTTAATPSAPSLAAAANDKSANSEHQASKSVPSPSITVTQGNMSGAATTKTLTSSGVTVTTIAPGKPTGNGPALIEVGRQIGQNPYVAGQPDPSVYEETKYGKLPVRSPTGARPMDVYARPGPGGGTRIAIIVGGLGLSQTGTLNAIDDLPAGVTLAFAASGNSLQRWMQLARRDGHEILLQVPMEPFGYPQTDPGPHTLTVAEGKPKELSDLHYAMGRLTNYTGIVNYMGGRFMADADAIEPVMRDVGRRGLLFIDDGSSGQSLAGKLATPLGVPFARADMQLDGDVARGAILAKLGGLEQVARRNGSAIGVASAFDESVDAIAAWAKEAQSRGIELVGVSALVNDPENKGN